MRLPLILLTALTLTACGPDPERYIVRADRTGLIVVSDVHRDPGRHWAVVHRKDTPDDIRRATQIRVDCAGSRFQPVAGMQEGAKAPTKVEMPWQTVSRGTTGQSILDVVCDPEMAKKAAVRKPMRGIERFWLSQIKAG